ncbi:hypothetical protein EDD16DRAFT_413654 [Pisolithus croceorrhizus]|nr:hypothetical protein EV401DRAFT_274569 [Pisolithus croceorrhizus]KAI6132519.1 hypothetical protein EDD16DRAFT_413654 [Pisolithus croceorrhizus]
MRPFYRSFSQLSAVHKGSAFEYRSLQLLQDHFSMLLRRVGGKSDGGIDLLGWWWLPLYAADAAMPQGHTSKMWPDRDILPRRRLRVLAQCKAEKKKFGPNYVREMEGVWHTHAYSPSRLTSSQPLVGHSHTAPDARLHEQRFEEHPHRCVALLISESPFTKSTLSSALSSTVPFLLLYLPRVGRVFPDAASASTGPSTMHSPIGAAYPNPPLVHVIAPLEIGWERPNRPIDELSSEMVSEGSGRPGLWLNGRRISSWTTDKLADM